MCDFVSASTIVELITEKATFGKDVKKPYIGLEHIETGGGKTVGYGIAVDSKSTNGVFLKGDILFGKLRPRLRKCVMADMDGYCSTDILVLRAKTNIDPGFAFRILSSEQTFLHAISSEEGTKMPRTSWRSLSGLSVWLPNLSEQCTIAAILDNIDQTIRQTEATIAKLRQVKAGMLHNLLTRGLDEKGGLRDPISHPEQFKDSPLGKIPKVWNVTKIGEIASHVGSGATPSGGSDVYIKNGVLFLRSQNITFDDLLLAEVAFIPEKIHRGMKRSEIFENDVLLNITGASIGRCCVFRGWKGTANVNQHVCSIRLSENSKGRSNFLAAYLASSAGQNQIFRFNAGSNREGLNFQQIRSIELAWPTTDIEFDNIMKSIYSIKERLSSEDRRLRKLKTLKHGLMHDLLTGRVRVPESMIEKYQTAAEVN
jgi:type I restriction enzyme, S subunit